jgi:hypothetical protein
MSDPPAEQLLLGPPLPIAALEMPAFSLTNECYADSANIIHLPLLASTVDEQNEQTFSQCFFALLLTAFVIVEWATVIIVFLAFMHHTAHVPTHALNSRFQVFMGAMISSMRPFLRLDFFGMPVPRPTHMYGTDDGFWGAIMSMYLKQNSAFENVVWPSADNLTTNGIADVMQETSCEFQGNRSGYQYTAAQIDTFHDVIELRYRAQAYIDNMPVVSSFGSGNGMWYGYEIGASGPGRAITLNNHADIHISVDNIGRVLFVGMDVWQTKTPCGSPSVDILQPGDTVYWTYRTYVNQTMSTLYEDRWKKNYTPANTELISNVQWFFLLSLCVALLNAAACHRSWSVYKNRHSGYTRIERQTAALLVGIDVEQALDITLFTEDDTKDRFSSADDDDDVVVASSSDDCGVTSALVTTLEMQRILPGTRDANVVKLAAITAATAINNRKRSFLEWKQYSHEVLGAPRCPTIYAAMVGRGTQFFVAILVALLLGMGYARKWNNAWQHIAIFVIPMTSHISGFVATRYATQFGVVSYLRMAVALTVGPFFFIMVLFVVVTNVELVHHDAGVTAGIVFLSLALLLLDVFHNICGIWLAKRIGSAKPFTVGSGVVRRNAPTFSWKVRYSTMGGTFILMTFFTAVPAFIITNEFLRSFWIVHIQTQIIIVICLVILWAWEVASFAIVLTHTNIKRGNLRWWWPTFIASGSSAFGIVAYAFFFLLTDTHFKDPGTIILVLLYVPVVASTVFVVFGAWGVHASWLFLRYGMYNKRCRSD